MKHPLAVFVGSLGCLAFILSELPPFAVVDEAIGQEAPPPAQKPVPPPAAPADGAPRVDESALRYFARQGDTKRMEAEIARLKQLYPGWTPPADPLAAPPQRDAKLDAMWKLFGEGRVAQAREAIAARQAAEPGWQVPTDLLAQLATAEARKQLVNASDLKQFDTVIRVGSTTPSLLTCADVDVLWRVAEAFARTNRPERAADAYRYVLQNCGDGPQRLATVRKAMPLLPRESLDTLLKLEKKDASGAGEFAPLRDDLARAAVGAGGAKPDAVVAQADLDTVMRLANAEKKVSDALLLGWYFVRRDRAEDASRWFAKARDAEDSAQASEGLALALIALKRPAEAENALFKWRDSSDDSRATYMAAVANTLAVSPPLPLDEARLSRLAAAVAENADAAAAQQFGWYADALNQFATAAQWFEAALGWKADDEPSAYGLALMRWKLGDRKGVAAVQREWAGRSERIATVGRPQRAGRQAAETGNAPASTDRSAGTDDGIDRTRTSSLGDGAAAEGRRTAAQRAGREDRSRGGCTSTLDPETLAPRAALARGWCLMKLNRPLEAANAFEVGLRSAAARDRGDAAYGQSLAYLQAGLPDKAAVAAVKSPQPSGRVAELQADLLSSRATSAFEDRRYNEAILALDQRARLSPEPTDLMVMRGYAYLKLGRPRDAEQIFSALAASGNAEAYKGLILSRARSR